MRQPAEEFRPMRRFRQQLSREECLAVLAAEKRGVLAVLGDGGYPYAVPLDFWYDAENDRLCFHGAKTGHKLDALARCDKASFCVCDQGFRRPGEWALNIRSVIVFGRVRPVTDAARTEHICRQLALRFYPEPEAAEKEVREGMPRGLCLELIPAHMTGKLVNES